MTDKNDWSTIADRLARESQQAREMISELRSELKEARRVIRELKQELDSEFKKSVTQRIDEVVSVGLKDYEETVSQAIKDAVAHVDRTFQKLANLYITGHESGRPGEGIDLRNIRLGE